MTCQPSTTPITRKVTAVAKTGASNQRAWPTLLSICFLRIWRSNHPGHRSFHLLQAVRPLRFVSRTLVLPGIRLKALRGTFSGVSCSLAGAQTIVLSWQLRKRMTGRGVFSGVDAHCYGQPFFVLSAAFLSIVPSGQLDELMDPDGTRDVAPLYKRGSSTRAAPSRFRASLS